MNFSRAKSLVREFLSSAPPAGVFERADELELAIAVAAQGEVEARLSFRLSYERKRNHARLSCSFHLHAPRLMTFPDDSAELTSMPSAMRREVLALRKRLSGRVLIPFARCMQVPSELAEPRLIDEWTDDDLVLHLLQLSTVAATFSIVPLPARTAEELLAWARERDATSEPAWATPPSSLWSVVGESPET